MSVRHVIVLEKEAIIASDMGEEVASLDEDALVRLATSVEDAASEAEALGRVDLLIVSHRSATFADDASFPALAETARSVMILSDEDMNQLSRIKGVHVARTPFTSSSLRRDLMGITVSGAPLFPQRPR